MAYNLTLPLKKLVCCARVSWMRDEIKKSNCGSPTKDWSMTSKVKGSKQGDKDVRDTRDLLCFYLDIK